jgi:hypothetical protein
VIKAADDEAALAVDGNPEAVLGFHAQQAIEKLAELPIPFELTHNLGRLAVALEAAGERLPWTPVALSDLNDFAVVYRYDLLFQISCPSHQDLIDTVRLIREHVLARIAALSAPVQPPPVQ